MHYRIQPAPRTDHITPDGTELTQRPYPIVCDQRGDVLGSPLIARVVGFVSDLARQEVDLSWATFQRHGRNVIGSYLIVQAPTGQVSTLATAIEVVEVLPDPPTGNALREQLREAPQRIGVHASHCCVVHGCKYGDEHCPVGDGITPQLYPCEECPEEPTTPAEQASADELLHHLRECFSALGEGVEVLKATMPVLAKQLAAMRTSMDELDRKMTHGHPLPGDWAARR